MCKRNEKLHRLEKEMREYYVDHYDFGINETIPMPAPELVKELETIMNDKRLPTEWFHTMYDAKQYILTPYYAMLSIQQDMKKKNENKKAKAAATRAKKIQKILNDGVVLE
jgi:hypothetical protein